MNIYLLKAKNTLSIGNEFNLNPSTYTLPLVKEDSRENLPNYYCRWL